MLIDDEKPQYIQQVEHLMTTVVTCRSLVKYNLPLSDEQKRDLQGDIEVALETLRSFLLAAPVAASNPAPTPSSQPAHQSAYMPAASQAEDTHTHKGVVFAHDHERSLLDALYRMYHLFLSAKHPVNINLFVNRFNETMSVLSEIEHLFDDCARGYDSCDEEAIADLLHRARVFIADLYSIFMEFMRALSETLQGNNVQLETEKLTSLSAERKCEAQTLPTSAHDLSPLFGVYEAQQRLNKKRGLLTGRVGEAVAFLEFLKESLVHYPQKESKKEDSRVLFAPTSPVAPIETTCKGNLPASINFSSDDAFDLSKQHEILLQLNNVSRLLHELSYLLTDYEQATAGLFAR